MKRHSLKSRIVSPCLAGLLVTGLGASWLCLSPPASAQRSVYQFVATFDHDEKLQRGLERLQQAGERKAWDEWVTLYQQLLDERPDGVVPQEGSGYTGLRIHLDRLFGQLPAEAKQIYRNRFDAAAKPLWDQASAAADAPMMRRLYNRYRQTSYARRALLWLANRDMDQGEFTHARMAYARLARDPAAPAAEVPWVLLKWAVAAAQVGVWDDVTAALEQLGRVAGAPDMRVGGRTMTAAEVVRRYRGELTPARMAAKAGASESAPSGAKIDLDWPAFAGPKSDRVMAGKVSDPVLQAWQVGLSTASASARSGRSDSGPWGGSPRTAYSPFSQLSLPVTYDANLFVQGATSVQCVRVTDGKILWTAKDPFEMNLPQRITTRFSSYMRSARSLQGAPIAARGRVYVRMPVGNTDGYSGSRWPADYALASLDARNGEPIWLRLAGGAPAGTYYNIPTLRSNTLYTGIATPVAGLTEYRAAAVDAGSGESRWSTYLGTGSDPMASTDGSPPAVGDDIVWVESSLHTLNALDALTGDILWIYRYQPRPTQYYRSGWQDTMTQTNEPLSLITTAAGRVFFSPRWGDDCLALDGRTGKLLWTKPKGEARTLFAVDAQRLYLCGDQLQALDATTGASKWTWAVPDSFGGLSALAGNRVYVPVGPMIYVLDATNGQKVEEIDLRKFNVEPGYNCVTIIGNRLYLSLPDRLVAYEQPGVPQSAVGRQEIAERK